MTTLHSLTNGASWIGIGIAGNQAGHLNQAGEANDFLNVKALENAPKGLFPWYMPSATSFLNQNPLSSDTISLNGSTPIQPEPEVALLVQLSYSSKPHHDLVDSVSVLGFTAFNDFSQRIQAPKISLKKNWGPQSQGVLDHIIPLEDFSSPGGLIDQFRLACFLRRNDTLHPYGVDTAVSDYCYFNATLTDWITSQLNHQTNFGPLENIAEMIADTRPEYALIGIGATCYTEFGNSDKRFLEKGDEVFVTLYHQQHYSYQVVQNLLSTGSPPAPSESLLVLHQFAQ